MEQLSDAQETAKWRRRFLVLLALVLALEVWPMVTFIRWRIAGARGLPIDRTHARTFARISHVQSLSISSATAARTER